MTPTLDWLWYALAAALALAALWLTYAAFLRDRARGRRRCPRCWYSMEGIPGTTCPECGKDAKGERGLVRMRRSWGGFAVAALLLLGGYLSFRMPAAQRDGWPAFLPTTMLIFVAPPIRHNPLECYRFNAVSESESGGRLPGVLPTWTEMSGPWIGQLLAGEVWARAEQGAAWQWQSQIFVSRYLKESGVDLRQGVAFPPRWLRGERIPIQPKDSIVAEQPFEVETTEGVFPLQDGATVQAGGPIRLWLVRNGNRLYQSHASIDTVQVDSASELLEPASGPQVDAMVLRALSPRLFRDEDGALRVLLCDRRANEQWRSLDFGIGLTVRVRTREHGEGVGKAILNWQWLPHRAIINVGITHADGSPVLAPEDPTSIEIAIESDESGPLAQYRYNPFVARAAVWRGVLRLSPGRYASKEWE